MPSIEKEMMYQEIEKEFSKSPYVFFSNFESVSVSDLSKARAKMNHSANRSMLVKHAMARKIMKGRGFADVESLLACPGGRRPRLRSCHRRSLQRSCSAFHFTPSSPAFGCI